MYFLLHILMVINDKCHLYVLVKCIEDHEDGRDIVLQVLHH